LKTEEKTERNKNLIHILKFKIDKVNYNLHAGIINIRLHLKFK
jgi:hypothetical protein